MVLSVNLGANMNTIVDKQIMAQHKLDRMVPEYKMQ